MNKHLEEFIEYLHKEHNFFFLTDINTTSSIKPYSFIEKEIEKAYEFIIHNIDFYIIDNSSLEDDLYQDAAYYMKRTMGLDPYNDLSIPIGKALKYILRDKNEI